MSEEKVLLVDDEQEFIFLLSERLEARGLRVDAVGNGSAAIDQVRNRNYDVVILDLAMPGMDGVETLKQLLAVDPDLQIIFLTGHATLQKGVEVVKLGAKEVLEKPADINVLLSRISDARDRKLLLFEKRLEERIRDILETKPW